jgi:hypothetical protein
MIPIEGSVWWICGSMLSIADIVEHSDTFATDPFGTLHGIGITMIGPEFVVPYYTVSHE